MIKLVWRLVPDDPDSSMPVLEEGPLPKFGEMMPIWIRAVNIKDNEVRIDYTLG
jgi:hypothetical protein